MTPALKTISPAQSAAFDLVRGVSAQLVLIGHAITANGGHLQMTIQDLGVVMFFLLSGFLVTSSALKRDTFEEFFVDRAARMFTPYVPCVLLIGLAGVAFNLSGPVDARTLTANVFMLQDFPLYRYIGLIPEIDRIGTGRPLWSVAMEWWFYMAFGALIFFRTLPWWSWILVGAGLFVAAFNATVGMLAYTWALGAVVAFVWQRLPRAPWGIIFLCTLVLVRYRYQIAADEFYDLRLNILLGVTLFAGLKAIELWRVPAWVVRFASAIAAYSYTLYLVHYTVLALTASIPSGYRVPVSFVIANAVAVALYFAFERHYKIVSSWLRRLLLRRPVANA